MRMILMAVVVTAFFISCEPKIKNDVKPVVKDSTIHDIDTVKLFFTKRYGLPRG